MVNYKVLDFIKLNFVSSDFIVATSTYFQEQFC